MKLTTEQQETLDNYVYDAVEYPETYTEFYDHILSALATKLDNMPFNEAVQSIVDEDFGGYNRMRKIELRHKASIRKEVIAKYCLCVIEYFKFPLVGVTAVMAALCYWITIQSWFGAGILTIMITSTRFVPLIMKWIKNRKADNIFRLPAKSIKQNGFIQLDFIFGFILTILISQYNFYSSYSRVHWVRSAHPATQALSLLIPVLHVLFYYKAYNDEFKIRIAQ